ncbi:MAG TPA: alpha/beta fold hydrolase [Polyangiaceae bacterium]|nr:alpha/beta fold hydrolase [Polyangiaceae bacterium]
MSSGQPAARPKRYELVAGRTLGLLHLREGAPGAPRLVCLPHSGGTPHVFDALAAALPADWSVRALDPPGHVRTRGAPLRSVDAIALACLEGLPAGLLEGAVLVGLSLGGYVALALARALARRAAPPPALVVLATRPPSERKGERPSGLGDDELFRWLVALGGVPGPQPEWRQIFDVFKDALRADLEAYATYDPGPDPTPPCPALFVGGHDDVHSPPELFASWRRDAPGARVELVPGGHFAVRDRAAEVAALVAPFVRQHWPAGR